MLQYSSHYDGEEDNEGEGIEEHGWPAIAYLSRQDVGQNFVSGLLKNCPHCRFACVSPSGREWERKLALGILRWSGSFSPGRRSG